VSYDEIRHFADSYGLGAMVVVYLFLAFWALRPGSRQHHQVAANMIFAEDGEEEPTDGDKNHG